MTFIFNSEICLPMHDLIWSRTACMVTFLSFHLCPLIFKNTHLSLVCRAVSSASIDSSPRQASVRYHEVCSKQMQAESCTCSIFRRPSFGQQITVKFNSCTKAVHHVCPRTRASGDICGKGTTFGPSEKTQVGWHTRIYKITLGIGLIPVLHFKTFNLLIFNKQLQHRHEIVHCMKKLKSLTNVIKTKRKKLKQELSCEGAQVGREEDTSNWKIMLGSLEQPHCWDKEIARAAVNSFIH